MRYLTLAAEFRDSPLRDDHPDSRWRIPLIESGLSSDLQRRIADWNDSYQKIIPMSLEKRGSPEVLQQIGDLDAVGRDLAREIARELDPAKVSYYSEGLLRKEPPLA